jgi:hypothetical protein
VAVGTSPAQTCVLCSGSTLATSVGTNQCVCISGATWASNSCSCSSGYVLTGTSPSQSCEQCGPSILATTSTNGGQTECVCINNAQWVPATSSCACSSGYAMIGTSPSQTCKLCDSSIQATGASLDQLSCLCISTFTWDNTLSVCSCVSGSIIVSPTSPALPYCLPCDGTVFSTGVNPSNTNQCLCPTGATWSLTDNTCECTDSTAVFINSGTTTYTCLPCSTGNFATAKVSATVCSCITTNSWIPNYGCQCPTGQI